MPTFIETSKERLTKYLVSKGVSASAFYRETGLNRGLIDNDKLSQQLSSDKIAIIIETYRDLNVEWLITGNGPMLKKEEDAPVSKVNESMFTYRRESSEQIIPEQFVPLYSIEATAGVLEQPDNSEYIKGNIYIPGMPECDGALHVTGYSMQPLLESGDIIAVKRIYDIRNIHYGDMYLISINEDGDSYTAVKWIHKHDTDDSKITLVSANPHYPPRAVAKKHVRTLALVKVCIRFNSR